MLRDETEILGGLGTYIDGKMKRYNLMFAVNGGAFAVAKLMAETGKAGDSILLGNLRLWHLAIGAILFTVMMGIDIYLWGKMMKDKFLGDAAFNAPGKIILVLLCGLLVSAWALVASG